MESESETERENGGKTLKFKEHSEEADWLIVGGQEDDWISLMMSVMSLTAWENWSDVKNSVEAENRGKQPDEWLQIFLTELMPKLH